MSLRRFSSLVPATSSIFSALGNPAVAMKATVPSGTELFVKDIAVLAHQAQLKVQKLPTGSLISGPAQFTFSGVFPPTVIPVQERWTVSPGALIASTAHFNGESQISGSGEMVLGASGGLSRVDVADGSEFVTEHDSIVAYTGEAPAPFFREGRLDVLQAWLSWVAAGTRTSYQWTRESSILVFNFTQRSYDRLRKLSGPSAPPLAIKGNVPDNASLTSGPVVDIVKRKEPSFLDTLRPYYKYLGTVQQWFGTLSDKMYYWSHPEKALFKGPCVVLIKSTR